MKKIDLSNVKEVGNGNYKKLPAGGYVLKIVKCEDVPSRNRLDFFFDIVEGEYKGFYADRYKSDTRENKKWGGRFSKSYDENNERALPFFKQFVTAVQNSNNGFVWDGEHEQQFVKKLVGASFREEEYIGNDGKMRVSCKPDMFHSVDKIRKGEFEVREIKKLDPTKVATTTEPTAEKYVDPFANDNAVADSVPWDDNSNPFA